MYSDKCRVGHLVQMPHPSAKIPYGGGKIWKIDSFRAFGERKFGELIDQPIDY